MNKVDQVTLTRRSRRVGEEKCVNWTVYNRGKHSVQIIRGTLVGTQSTIIPPGNIRLFSTRPTLRAEQPTEVAVVSYH